VTRCDARYALQIGAPRVRNAVMVSPKSKAWIEAPCRFDDTQDIGYALMQTTRAYRKALAQELAPHDLTFRQFQVLNCLWQRGDLSQCLLAQSLLIEPPTLAGILSRLERNGLICRTSDPSDSRRKVVRLDGSARQLCLTLRECAARVCDRAVQGIPPEQLDSLQVILRRILQNLHEPQSATRCRSGTNPGAQVWPLAADRL
jgi:MarR family transcriptional regulator, transcriptional regulator for hemolysin